LTRFLILIINLTRTRITANCDYDFNLGFICMEMMENFNTLSSFRRTRYFRKYEDFALYQLIKLGLILDVEITQSIENNDDIIKIQSIKILDGIHQTYCFNESKEHSGIFNGILTGQSETYSLQIDNIVKDTDEKKKII